jgi:hypothetical protein
VTGASERQRKAEKQKSKKGKRKPILRIPGSSTPKGKLTSSQGQIETLVVS